MSVFELLRSDCFTLYHTGPLSFVVSFSDVPWGAGVLLGELRGGHLPRRLRQGQEQRPSMPGMGSSKKVVFFIMAVPLRQA